MAVPPSRFLFLVLLGCGLCTASFSLRAQQPATAQVTPSPVPLRRPNAPGLPPPPALPQVPGDALPGSGPGEPPVVRLHFPNSLVVDILHYYEQYSGKHVLYDSTVQGSITIDVDNVTRTDALRIMETALSLNGYILIPGDNNVIKVIGLGKQPRAAGVPIFSDIALVPDTDQFVTFLVRLHYLDPTEMAGILGQYIPPTNNAVGFTALKSAGALLITDTARSVRRLVGLINQLDLPASPVTEKFIALQRAEATKAVEFLNGVFDIKSAGATPGQPGVGGASSNQPATRRPIRRIGEDGQPVEVPGLAGGFGSGPGGVVLSGDSLIQGRITLTADIRTNRVHIVTSPVNMPLVERLLLEYDADTPFAQPVRRPLRFVRAGEMLPILVDALKEQGSDSNNSTPSATASSTPSRSSSSSSNPFGNNNGSGNSSFGGSNGLGSGGLNDSSNDTQSPEVDTKPTEATVGNNKLIADQRTNTIILLGGADAKSKVFEILDQLDVRTPQVVIRTVIGEMALDNNHELGFQYLLRSNRGSLVSQFNPGLFNGSTSGTPTTGTGTDTGTTTGGTSSTSTALNTFGTLATGLGSSFTGVGGILAIGRSLDIIVSALESTSRFKTISRPMIVTSNNKKAKIFSGTEVPIPTGSVGSLNTTGASTGVYSTIQLESVGIQLEVTPLINSEKEVTLDITQDIDSLSGGSTTINGSAIPSIAKRRLENHISAANGETIVLGGLITQNDNRGSSDIPYLSRIPVLGNLFKTKTRDVSRNELIILMHPEVVNTAGIMADVREREENRTYLGHDLEDQLLPSDPVVRKALPVKKTTTIVQSTTYVPDDKLHPVARKATVKSKTTTVRPD